jgi:hypothetical protein
MDLREFYQKLREIEEAIEGAFAVIVSCKTADGGRAGVCSEVTRGQAARLVAEQRARLATAEEAANFRKAQAEAARQAVESQLAERLQLTVISDAELRGLRGRVRPKKG